MKTELVPSGINFNRLLKREMLFLFNHRCKEHGRRYTEHPKCFLKDFKDKLEQPEVIGFLDIETSNLNADFGYIFCYSIKELDGELIHRSVTPEEIIVKYQFDKNLMKQFNKDIQRFDRLVVYWGKDRRHDVPFLRTRALVHRLPFPEYKDKFITDVYDWVRNKCNLSRNRLENIARLLNVPAKQHRLDPVRWNRAQAGHIPSLKWIQKHCDEDVISLEGAFKRLWIFATLSKTSI